MKMTDTWNVNYMMNGTAYQERVEVGNDLSYLVGAMVAMDKVKEANENELTDMTAQKVS